MQRRRRMLPSMAGSRESSGGDVRRVMGALATLKPPAILVSGSDQSHAHHRSFPLCRPLAPAHSGVGRDRIAADPRPRHLPSTPALPQCCTKKKKEAKRQDQHTPGEPRPCQHPTAPGNAAPAGTQSAEPGHDGLSRSIGPPTPDIARKQPSFCARRRQWGERRKVKKGADDDDRGRQEWMGWQSLFPHRRAAPCISISHLAPIHLVRCTHTPVPLPQETRGRRRQTVLDGRRAGR